jgi:MtaA/CmuA family methyltransferase
MSTMTPRQRYDAILDGRTPDIVPRIPILMQFAAEYIGSNYAAFASDHRVLVEANLRCAQDFGLDQLSTISDPYRETAGFGAEIRFHANAGPECVRPPLADATPGDNTLAGLTVPDPFSSPRMKDRIDAIRLYRERTGENYSVLGWVEGPAALGADLRGLSEFLMDLMEEPEWSGKLMDLCVETSIRFARAQIEAGADTIGIGDAICSQISGGIYESLIWSRQLRLMQAIKSAGARIRLHICGQTQHLWPRLRELPIDILDCDHMVDLAAARAALPSHWVLAGNVDPVSDLRFGGADSIPAKVMTCARVSGPRFMVCAGCEIPSGTPAANLHAFCEPRKPVVV